MKKSELKDGILYAHGYRSRDGSHLSGTRCAFVSTEQYYYFPNSLRTGEAPGLRKTGKAQSGSGTWSTLPDSGYAIVSQSYFYRGSEIEASDEQLLDAAARVEEGTKRYFEVDGLKYDIRILPSLAKILGSWDAYQDEQAKRQARLARERGEAQDERARVAAANVRIKDLHAKLKISTVFSEFGSTVTIDKDAYIALLTSALKLAFPLSKF